MQTNKNRQQRQKTVTVTTCPPGCGNGICPRVFEDCLGLGCSVHCICNRSGCHKESSERGDPSLLTSKSDKKMKIRKSQKGGGAVSNQSPQPQGDIHNRSIQLTTFQE